MSQIQLTVNGSSKSIDVPPMKRLLDVLREDLHLTGAKEGCGEGECGACAILFNGELANSCLIPALQANNATITTIEGLSNNNELHPIQQCFLQEGGAQCGICTPGMILATHHLLAKHPHPTLDQIKEGLAGNLCRCTGYMRIFESVQRAATLSTSTTALNLVILERSEGSAVCSQQRWDQTEGHDMEMPNSLDHCWDEWIKKARELNEKGTACCAPFFSSKPSGYDNSSRKVLLVGKATAGWYWNGGRDSLAILSDRQLAVGQLQTNLAEREWREGKQNRGFWDFMLRTASAFGDDSPNPQNLIWSNLFKIGGEKGNPGLRLAAYQEDLAIQTLQLEINAYRPDVVIFTTIGYFENVVRKVVGMHREPDWVSMGEGSQDETWTLRNSTRPQILWTRHPAFKSSKTIDCLVERAVAL
jgi:aerobic carbon-monoxide dehydrogenase small subunit